MTTEPLPEQAKETTMTEEEEEEEQQQQQQSSNKASYYYSNDYDYLGTGGFLIECCDLEILGVTSSQRLLVERNCTFIKNCFRHKNTFFLESNSNILRKPDWSLCIARHLIEVLTKGVTTLPTLDLYQQLMSAGDQILLDLKLCNFVNYMDPIIINTTTTVAVNNNNGSSISESESTSPADINNNKESYYYNHDNNRFLDLISPTKYRFKFKGNIKSEQWIELLTQKGVLLNRKETNYVVKLIHHQNQNHQNDDVHNDHVIVAPPPPPSRQQQHYETSRRQLDTRNTEFCVHADQTIQAIYEIQNILYYYSTRKGGRVLPMSLLPEEDERFSIYFETTTPITKDQHELIDRLAGGETYIRTCADAHSKKTEGYTVQSSFDVLRRAIKPLVVVIVPSEKNKPNATSNTTTVVGQPPPSYQSRQDDDRSTTTTTTANNNQKEPKGQHPDDDNDNNVDGHHTGTGTGASTTIEGGIDDDDDDAVAAGTMNPNCMIHCSLRIDNPTPDTLGRFINACCQTTTQKKEKKKEEDDDDGKTTFVIKDYPSTLGMDAANNRYFVRKTMRDVYSILVYMSDYSTSSKIMSQDFTLYELSGEDQPF